MTQQAFGFASGYTPPPKIARDADPQTSKQAAAETKPILGYCQQVFVKALERLGVPSTAAEIAVVANQINGSKNTESYRKRAAECVEVGSIEPCEARKCGVTGKKATTYRIKQ